MIPPGPRVVLASTSSIRRILLERLCIPFDVISPDYEETDLGFTPDLEARARATGKAESVIPVANGGIVIGSDQLLVINDRKVPKPLTEDSTVELLLSMRGIRHQLHTAISVFDARSNQWVKDTTVSSLVVRNDITKEGIIRYVSIDQSMGCAGGYKLESLGICLFSEIDTPDYTAILGLPLISLCSALRSLGVEIPPYHG